MWVWKLLQWWYCFYNPSGLCKRQVDLQHITFLIKIPGFYRNGICDLRGLKLRGDDQLLSQNIFPRSYVGCSSSEFVVVVLLGFVCVFVCVFPGCCHIWNSFLYLYCPPYPFLFGVNIFKGQLMRTLGIDQVRAAECLSVYPGHLILSYFTFLNFLFLICKMVPTVAPSALSWVSSED